MIARPVVRKLWAVVNFTGLYAVGCSPGGPDGDVATAYLEDPAFARAALVASLVNASNGYSALRLAHYATGADGDWDRLPEWNPPAEAIQAAELDAPGGAATDTLSSRAAPLPLPPSVASEDDPALLELGRAAFFRYPMQLAPYARVALGSRQDAARYGLWIDEDGRALGEPAGVGGLVRARMADGRGAVALTCSSCHARAAADGALAPGLPNAALDVGAAILATQGVPAGLSEDPIAAWGPGRIDVTTASGVEPARIPDLRPVRWLTHLQQDGTVRARNLAALAIRIETLIVTSGESVLRPPRVVALALAAYVRSLAQGLPSAEAAAAAAARGAAVFAGRCAACHTPPAFTGAPVPLEVVATDPTLGLSRDRGTGFYRVPSLHGVGTRGPLLHDGTVPSVGALLDPTRVGGAFTGRLHGFGPIAGHLYGLDLDDDDRQALIGYLDAL